MPDDPVTGYRAWQIIRNTDGSVRFEGNALGVGHYFDDLDNAMTTARALAQRASADEEIHLVPLRDRTGGDWANMQRIHPE